MDLSFSRRAPGGDAQAAAGPASPEELARIAAALGGAHAPGGVAFSAADGGADPVRDEAGDSAALVAGAFNPAMAGRLARWRIDGVGP